MPNEKKDFFNIAELSKLFHEWGRTSSSNNNVQFYMACAMLAQAQQMAVIAGRLDEIASYLGEIVSKAKGTT